MKSLMRALGYLKKYWLLAVGLFASLLLASALNLAIPALTQQIIDNGIAAGSWSFILYGALAMVGVALLRPCFPSARILGGQGFAERAMTCAMPCTKRFRTCPWLPRPRQTGQL